MKLAWKVTEVRSIKGYAISKGAVLGDLPGVAISVDVGTLDRDGQFVADESWGVSKLEGLDSGWILDSRWKTKNMYPIFSHGEGSRCSDIRHMSVKDEAMAFALDESARRGEPYNELVEVPDPNQGKLFGDRWAVKVRRCGTKAWAFLASGRTTNRLKVHALSWSTKDAAEGVRNELAARTMTGDEFKVVKL